MNSTAIRRESISITIDDITHTGERVIEGTRYRYQRVEYRGHTKADSFRYEADQSAYMDLVAQQLLREIVRDIAAGL